MRGRFSRALRSFGPALQGVGFALLLTGVAPALTACGAVATQGPVIAAPKPAPSFVTDATFDDALRHYELLSFDDPAREPLRQRLVEHQLTKAAAVLSSDYSAVVEYFASVTALYTPTEIAGAKLPAALEPVARHLVEKGSPRGDEPRVLSALLVLRSIHPDDKAVAELYRRIKEWGFDARAALSSPLDRYEAGMIELWEEHARLTPTPEVLAMLAKIYIEQRNTLVGLLQSSERRAPLNQAIFEGAQRTGMSVAAVYLRHGDVASALANVRAMGSTGRFEQRLIEMLERAREEGAEGTGALLELANGYRDYGHAEVSRALCLLGFREQPQDARFPQCLANIATLRNDFAGAMAWYAEAVRLMPEERALYDQILQALNDMMEQGLFVGDSAQTRAIAARAAEILEERIKRWPKAPPEVKPEDLYLAIGVAEMNAGNAKEAEARLRKSIEAKETLGGLLQLGLLLERVNRSGEAAELYRRALTLAAGDKTEDEQREQKRAEIMERLGDALRMLGKPKEAGQMYEQGLSLWDQNLSRQKGQRIGLAQLRRGVLLGRLARRGDSVTAFEKAMALAPEMRETYATILAYLAVSDPDSRFAHQVFHTALNQLSLEPEWKVYFALWLRMIAGRSGGKLDSDVSAVLEDLSHGTSWGGKLAKFAVGGLSFEDLFGEASDIGERTEAYFYEGARRLGSGDKPGAREMFQHVIDSNMVNFYEFAMAQELIAQSAPDAPHTNTIQAQAPTEPAR